ncbi:MAG: hypothetical protein JOZ64_08535 [Solirubrobacterales bacterium]|nr:hypothetical protein [Solirubrobacterales bacterium]
MAALAVLPASLAVAIAGPANAAGTADTNGQAATSSPALTAAAVLAGKRAETPGARVTAEEALTAYWTPARMKAALPADDQAAVKDAARTAKSSAASDLAAARAHAAKNDKPAPAGAQSTVAPADAVKSSPAGKASGVTRLQYTPGYQYWEFAARTSGKVYFTNTTDGLNYVCSGTIVNSGGKDMVWTAGHCVHGGAGGNWHANWVFVPSYTNGWAPYGYWYASQLWTQTAWMNSSEWESDMGVAIVGTNYGYHIVDYLGGQGITWNQSKHIGVTVLGYPAESPYDGQTLQACSGTTFPEWKYLSWSSDIIGLHDCNLTGGSSGGGWFAFFDGEAGYVDGNTSFKYNDDPNSIYSPYFGDRASNLYDATKSL